MLTDLGGTARCTAWGLSAGREARQQGREERCIEVEGENVTESIEAEGEDVTEVRQHRKTRIPRAPTKSDRDSHVPLHFPVRCWSPV